MQAKQPVPLEFRQSLPTPCKSHKVTLGNKARSAEYCRIYVSQIYLLTLFSRPSTLTCRPIVEAPCCDQGSDRLLQEKVKSRTDDKKLRRTREWNSKHCEVTANNVCMGALSELDSLWQNYIGHNTPSVHSPIWAPTFWKFVLHSILNNWLLAQSLQPSWFSAC